MDFVGATRLEGAPTKQRQHVATMCSANLGSRSFQGGGQAGYRRLHDYSTLVPLEFSLSLSFSLSLFLSLSLPLSLSLSLSVSLFLPGLRGESSPPGALARPPFNGLVGRVKRDDWHC